MCALQGDICHDRIQNFSSALRRVQFKLLDALAITSRLCCRVPLEFAILIFEPGVLKDTCCLETVAGSPSEYSLGQIWKISCLFL